MIHETAIIDPSASIAEGVTIGPYSIIGPEVSIGEGTVVGPHVVIKGPTTIGKNNQFFQFSSIGEDCQDRKYNGEKTTLTIGDGNIFREGMTISRGTVQDQGKTIIGSNSLFMAYVHIAHDCVVGDNVTFANNASLAGHVHVGDHATLGGFVGVHQFVHIGAYSFCAGGSVLVQDVPSYVMVQGYPAKAHGLNLVGLKRKGFSSDDISNLKKAYRLIYRQGLTVAEAVAQIEETLPTSDAMQALLDFVKGSERGIVR